MYSVKEIFYTIQGEGFHAGRPAVFCRFSGCNLWNGIEQDKKNAICNFCDTDFVGTDGNFGGKYTAQKLAERINLNFPIRAKYKYVVLTGGEPLLQVDENLINEIHKYDIEIAVETNGTIKAPEGLDWICVSPKSNSQLIQNEGDEIKIVIPQLELDPRNYENLNFSHFYLQPKDEKNLEANTQFAIIFCKFNSQWNLSIQTHKILNIE